MSEGLNPEEIARIDIDEMLKVAGWDIVTRNEYSAAYNACAIVEALLIGSLEVDYLLVVGEKAIGVLEAKRKSNKLSLDVADQAEGYARKLPEWCPKWFDEAPFVFLSNGNKLLFRDMREKDSSYVELKKMMSPKELVRLANIKAEYAALPALPPVGEGGLRQCQYDAIRDLEKLFKFNNDKALITLATGAGKTFTACTFTYRFLTYSSVRRVLFLVDRNNLGKQAEGAFSHYKLTENGEVFNSIYNVKRLTNINDIPKTGVIISTIQRLFAAISGNPLEEENDNEESDYMDFYSEEDEEEISIEGELMLPQDFFDLIIIDECHRSIYGKWKQVLKYFNKAKVIGLTATPTLEAEAFFNRNRCSVYSFEDSVRDGVNVAPRVYRIKTRVSEDGGVIQENEQLYKESKFSGKANIINNPNKEEYDVKQLDKSVVNIMEIRKVIQAYKDAIYTSLYPERIPNWHYIPKTLIFAKSDSHASNIVEQIKEVFKEEFPEGLPEDYVQKITYSAGDTNELIRQFRNNKEFRIAVTVTLVATGTDIPPLECVFFMRDVASNVLYTQMKGRGCRKINDEDLQKVTPNAASKDFFFIIDAVGVTEHEHLPTVRIGGEKKIPSLQRLLELLSFGNVSDENLILLSNYLAKCLNKGYREDIEEWDSIAGITLKEFLTNLNNALKYNDSSLCEGIVLLNRDTFSINTLPPYISNEEKNAERKLLISALIDNTKARKKILEINAGFIKILMPGDDEIIYTGFTQEDAQTYIESLEKYLNDNRDRLEALRIIYNDKAVPSFKMLEELQTNLLKENGLFKPSYIWQNYKLIRSDNSVISLESRSEVEAITNLIQIARYVYGKTKTLVSLFRGWERGFNLYTTPQQRNLNKKQIEFMKKIARYIVQNGAVKKGDILNGLGSDCVVELIKIFDKDNVDAELDKLANFVLRDYTNRIA